MGRNTPKITLEDTIYANIRREITERVLLPGERINIKELAERYGASQTPVKLALNRLISENIIENFPRQGMHVKLVSTEEIEEIFDMRLMLDLYMTKQIITTVTYNEDVRNRLCKNVADHLEIISSEGYDSSLDAYLENYRLDREFHEMYLKCTGSKKILDMFHYIDPFLYTNYIFRKQSREKDISGVREHEDILKAILAEDEEGVKRAVTVHNANAKHAVSLIIRVNQIL